jgi:hypothetical protein
VGGRVTISWAGVTIESWKAGRWRGKSGFKPKWLRVFTWWRGCTIESGEAWRGCGRTGHNQLILDGGNGVVVSG